MNYSYNTEGYANDPGINRKADIAAFDAVQHFRSDVLIKRDPSGLHTVHPTRDDSAVTAPDACIVAQLLGLYPEYLGAPAFGATHGSRFAYVVGEMARGIATTQMVSAAVRSGFCAFFGSAGLRIDAIDAAITTIRTDLGEAEGYPVHGRTTCAWGMNLIHSPDRPDRERESVDLFLARAVTRVSASAFMKLSADVVRYACRGLTRAVDGSVTRRNFVFAKVSRPEVAAQFMTPAPPELLRDLVAAGLIESDEAELAAQIPVAEDITIESDFGGHTDNRPLAALFPVILRLRHDIAKRHPQAQAVRLGAAGGLGTPHAVAAAFQLGADYVLTGSVNQCAIESGLSPKGRALLGGAGLADVAMAPAADMFELGVKVQVLKRATMFASKAQRLYELYRHHEDLASLPAKDRDWLERQVFRNSCEAEWELTRAYLAESGSPFLAKAEADQRACMALLFRRYLSLASQWARDGVEDRAIDYQIWCGPAMGAFNDWVRDFFLEPVANRTVAQIGLNLLEGAAAVTRAHQLHVAGVRLSPRAVHFAPRPLTLDWTDEAA